MTSQDIAELRRRLGLTQTAFALRIGVTVDAVRHYEAGRRTPSDRVMTILEALRSEQEVEVPA